MTALRCENGDCVAGSPSDMKRHAERSHLDDEKNSETTSIQSSNSFCVSKAFLSERDADDSSDVNAQRLIVDYPY